MATLEDKKSRSLDPGFDADRARRVPVNVYETDDAVVVVAAMPAVMADDITVEVDGRRLTLRAGLRSAAPKEYLVQEWAYGDYERTVELPLEAGQPATASYGNGQLAVRLTKGGDRHTGQVPVTQA